MADSDIIALYSQELKLSDKEKDLQEDLLILDTVVQADDFFYSKNFQAAYDNYLKAYQFSSSNDKNTRIYIHRRLTSIENQLDMQQFLLPGDYLFQNGEYDEAEILYSKANKRAEVRNDAAKKLSDKMQAAFNDALKKCDDALAAA